ncbi:NACHT domain-containing protein [Lentzea sp. NPDC051213]|uniref:NACHT domain-containing protein n=1 Tax=Lentzea sp. NPDC051213 TaxID=3364126 RepID=UPI0037A1E63A
MRRTYTYTEAVKILGGKDHPVVAALDKLLGGALLAGSLGTWQVLALFDAKPDFTRLFSELATKVSDRRRKLNRYDRTQRLHAAHAVIVVTAYFEALHKLELPFLFTREDDEHVVGFDPFGLALPLPSAGQLYEDNVADIHDVYLAFNEDLLGVATALAAWDRLNETEKDRVAATLKLLPVLALERYQELFRQLAVDFPEVAFWCSIEDHRATRAALARLEDVLREATADPVADVRLAELAGIYGSALSRPLVKSGDVPQGLRIPALGEAYVDPRFQLIARGKRETVPSTAEFWDQRAERSDLYAYLAGYLTSREAWLAPLLVLGDPGSGKSVLTEMLAARLSASGSPVVRVELRSAPADADLRRQIEHGLHRLLDEPVGWAVFSRDTGGAVPVVILDGLDELMQATGVSQTRYLTAIEEFQADLLARNRPAVFVVTSRLSVCAGLALPQQSHVVRLLPFSDDQVRQWMAVWNAVNPPLPVDVVLEYRELAQQPLLLLMLALYDAVDGALQRDHQQISRGELYERLLERFARREVAKSPVERTENGLAEDVEFELDRLSVVALAMFNRGTQWVTGHQVTADLAALLDHGSADREVGTRTPLSSGELALGRFFFVQKSEAVRGDDTKLATYEFLHATFGEYLVARFVWRALVELSREDAARSRRKSTVDDTELYSLLSFMALTSSKPVLDFLQELTGRSDRELLFDLVVRLFGAREERRLSRGEYEPASLTDSARDARYSVNLVALAVALRDKVYAPDLRVSVEDWQREALFWKSRLSSSEWTGVVRCFWVERDRDHHFALSLSNRTQDVRAEWLLMSEPYVTLDKVAVTLRDAVTPLASRYSIEVTEALIALTAVPIERCVAALRWLAHVDERREVIMRETYRRLGLGGDDMAILAATQGIAGSVDDGDLLDALLRLHERGFQFDQAPEVQTLEEALTHFDFRDVVQRRPDLLRRATVAASELGLEWPPSRWPPAQRGPAR